MNLSIALPCGSKHPSGTPTESMSNIPKSRIHASYRAMLPRIARARHEVGGSASYAETK